MSHFNSAIKLGVGAGAVAALAIAAKTIFASAKNSAEPNRVSAPAAGEAHEHGIQPISLIQELKNENLPFVMRVTNMILDKHRIPHNSRQVFEISDDMISRSFADALDASGEQPIRVETLRRATLANINSHLKDVVDSWSPVLPMLNPPHL